MQLGETSTACADYKDAIKLGFKTSFDYKQITETNPKYLDEYFGECK